MRIYTRTGDSGQTSLADSSRVPKDSPRLDAYGTIDELNSHLGVAQTMLLANAANGCLQSHPNQKLELESWIRSIQNDLFNLGSDLATPVSSRWENMVILGDDSVKVLEKIIDRCEKELPPLRNFILPGGNLLSAQFHVCRTVCRRAERLVVSLQSTAEINPVAVSFLNRLSGFFFVVSRWTVAKSGHEEFKWDKQGGLTSLQTAPTKT